MVYGRLRRPAPADGNSWTQSTPEGAGAEQGPRQQRVLAILNALLTAEKLESALYAEGLRSGVLSSVEPDEFGYFQAGLSEEFFHARLLEDLGASIPNTRFWFPPRTFTDLSVFLNQVIFLESTGVAAYSAAIYQFAGSLRRPVLAEIGAQILGIEAEHRVLARDVAGLEPPNNLCIERVPSLSVARIAQNLTPYLSPNQFGGRSVGPIPFPNQQMVDRLVGPNACVNPGLPFAIGTGGA